MTLQDFTTEQLKDMKQACLDTRRQYIDAQYDWDCPLCKFDNMHGIGLCFSCPWIILTSASCYTGKDKYKQLLQYTFEDLKNGINKRWTTKRIKELTQWADLIQEEIDSRK